MTRRSAIGFDRRIDIEWLDAAAAQAATGAPNRELRAYLWNLLEGVVSGDKLNSGRGKTVTVLNHIWGDVPPAAKALRARALVQLESATAEERLALHWVMMIGTYPVFTDVAAAVGRLITLQGQFSLAHLTRRLVALWGERSTLTRAAQRIIRSMIQWGALRDTDSRGVYEAVPSSRTVRPELAVLMLEALLTDADEGAMPFDQLAGHPALFPFELELSVGHLRGQPQFAVHRQGLDVDVVELRVDDAFRAGSGR